MNTRDSVTSALPKIPDIRWRALSVTVVRVCIGALFCASGLLKMVYPEQFLKALTTYGISSQLLSDSLSYSMPSIEFCLGMMAILGVKVRIVGCILALLLVLFLAAGGYALVTGNVGDCGCFPLPERDEPLGASFFARNGLLLIGCLWVVLSSGVSESGSS
jgi:uncharacterized membrane protein YphA (DoxX/SURF4 family)